MDAATPLREFLEDLKRHHYARGNFLGLLHVLIGRRIAKDDGTVVSAGMTWRELAALLKKLRWDKDDADQLKIELEELPTRDRERFWYSAIARARVDSPEAAKAGDKLADVLRKKGYVVSQAPK
jgi:hypothetical protein